MSASSTLSAEEQLVERGFDLRTHDRIVAIRRVHDFMGREEVGARQRLDIGEQGVESGLNPICVVVISVLIF